MISIEPAPMLEDKEKWFVFKSFTSTFILTVIVSATLQVAVLFSHLLSQFFHYNSKS